MLLELSYIISNISLYEDIFTITSARVFCSFIKVQVLLALSLFDISNNDKQDKLTLKAETFNNVSATASQLVNVTMPAGYIAVVGVWARDPSGNPVLAVQVGNPASNRILSIWIGKFQQLGSIFAYGAVTTGTKLTISVYYI